MASIQEIPSRQTVRTMGHSHVILRLAPDAGDASNKRKEAAIGLFHLTR